jgi:DNA-binding transcriptional ArsR family regulator
VLVKFFIRAANKGHLNALASEFGESTNGVRKELNKLKDAGYLISNKEQNKVIYRANTEHPLYSVLQQLVKKHLRLDEMVEAIVKRIGDVQKIILIGDYAKGIDSGLIEVLLIAKNINENYIIELEKKLKNKIGRKVVFFMDSEDDGIVLYDKEIMYYEN